MRVNIGNFNCTVKVVDNVNAKFRYKVIIQFVQSMPNNFTGNSATMTITNKNLRAQTFWGVFCVIVFSVTCLNAYICRRILFVHTSGP